MHPRWFKVGVIGMVTAILCCATPLAVIVLGALGLGAFAFWIDIVAIPAVLIFGLLAIVAYRSRGAK